MIYNVKAPFSLIKEGSHAMLFSKSPFTLLRVASRAEKVLELLDGYRTLSDIARAMQLDEKAVFGFCEYLRARGILELSGAKAPGALPSVTVIVPVKDRWEDLFECLDSLFGLSYPKEKLDVLVVDDASKEEVDLEARYPVRLLRNRVSKGQSFCRNFAARHARGEVLAFLDSDCVAEPCWLEDLVPYVCWDAIGAVGGYVDGYWVERPIDRYEKAVSPLCMGGSAFFGSADTSMAYVPFCNVLVRKEVYAAIGGLREELSVGEDVDFCLRMREAGLLLLYMPRGRVRHKHRRRLLLMLRRRFEYGSSEASLYSLHRERRKILPLSPFVSLTFFLVSLSILLLSPTPLFLSPAPFLADLSRRLKRVKGHLSASRVADLFLSVLRSYLSSFYFISFHLLRYYLLFLGALSLVFPPFGLYVPFLLFFCGLLDYHSKRPNLLLPLFLFYYVLDHLSYQMGVLYGSFLRRSLLAYRVSFNARSRPSRRRPVCPIG